MKRVLAAVLALVMILGSVPLAAFASETECRHFFHRQRPERTPVSARRFRSFQRIRRRRRYTLTIRQNPQQRPRT